LAIRADNFCAFACLRANPSLKISLYKMVDNLSYTIEPFAGLNVKIPQLHSSIRSLFDSIQAVFNLFERKRQLD
jgi:hypothetical protein